MKSQKKKKTKGRFEERWGVRRSLAAIEPTAITKKTHCKRSPYCDNHTNATTTRILRRFFSTAAIVSAENDIFIAAVLCPTTVGHRKRLYL